MPASLFESDTLNTWLSPVVQPAESSTASPQHRNRLGCFVLSPSCLSWKYVFPGWWRQEEPEVRAPSSSLRPGKTWNLLSHRAHFSQFCAISTAAFALLM